MIPVSILRLLPLRDASLNTGLYLGPATLLDSLRCTEMSSGHSRNQVWKIDKGDNDQSIPIVVRRWNTETYSVARLTNILEFQANLSKKQIAAPTPLQWITGELVIDLESSLWSIESWMPGKSLTFRELISDGLLKDLTHTLAAMHVTGALFTKNQSSLKTKNSFEPDSPIRGIPHRESQGLAERISKIRYWTKKLNNQSTLVDMDATIDNAFLLDRLDIHQDPLLLEKSVISLGIRCAANRIIRAGEGWIHRLVSLQRRNLTVHWIIRDLWRENILIQADRVSGIVDFGASRVDWPMFDLVRCLTSYLLPHDARLSQVLDEYRSSYESMRAHTCLHGIDSQDDFIETFHLLDKIATTLSVLYWFEQMEAIKDTETATQPALGWLRLQELSDRSLAFENH